MPIEPIEISGTTFLSDLLDEIEEGLGYVRGRVRRDTEITWIVEGLRYPVLEVEIMDACMAFVSPRYVWKWGTLEEMMALQPDDVTSVYDLDFREMYLQIRNEGKGPFPRHLDFKTVGSTAEWVTEKIIRGELKRHWAWENRETE